jgi:hypothetical protein
MAVTPLDSLFARARAIAALPVADWPAAVAALDDYERGVVRAYLCGWLRVGDALARAEAARA